MGIQWRGIRRDCYRIWTWVRWFGVNSRNWGSVQGLGTIRKWAILALCIWVFINQHILQMRARVVMGVEAGVTHRVKKRLGHFCGWTDFFVISVPAWSLADFHFVLSPSWRVLIWCEHSVTLSCSPGELHSWLIATRLLPAVNSAASPPTSSGLSVVME